MTTSLKTYREWSPTAFDTKGLGLEDRADWLVGPCILTRDADAIEQANWESMVATLDSLPDGGYEVHHFRHWACGWFDIVLTRPGSGAADVVAKCARRLADYPILDEMRLSEIEMERGEICD